MSPLYILLPLLIADPDTSTPMRTFLPVSVDGWTISEPPRLYSGKEIFEYMDGAGEVYLAYRFERLLVQRYARPDQEEILVEIFDMGASQNAFGTSTYMRGRGPGVRVGRDGEFKNGLLCFWRGRYYVCVKIERENPRATRALLTIGKMIAKAIGVDGERPRLLGCLPAGAYQPKTVRYFFREEILNTHFSLPEGILLPLKGIAEGLLVRLKRDRSHLLVLVYSDVADAESAYQTFSKTSVQDDSMAGIFRSQNGTWTACERINHCLMLNVDASTTKGAHDILATVGRRLP
jgi:hypothetical protein